jgi:hypothetical protein
MKTACSRQRTFTFTLIERPALDGVLKFLFRKSINGLRYETDTEGCGDFSICFMRLGEGKEGDRGCTVP